MTRKSRQFPSSKPKRLVEWMLRAGDPASYRRELAEKWLSEEPYASYRYNVEKCEDGSVVYLLRPTYLNKGFDFQVNLEGFRSATREPRGQTIEMPSHDDVFDDLRRKLRAAPKLAEELFGAVCDTYDCREPDHVLAARPKLRRMTAGLPADKLMKVIKWLFIEQDLTYWLGTGRNMLMSGIEENCFGIDAPLKA